jgi:hypothetical protein
VNWLTIGAVTFVGIGVAAVARVVEVSSTWRLVSYAIAVGVLVGAAIRIVASLVFIEIFDPFLVSDLIVAAVLILLVPTWAILLSRGVAEPAVDPIRAAI